MLLRRRGPGYHVGMDPYKTEDEALGGPLGLGTVPPLLVRDDVRAVSGSVGWATTIGELARAEAADPKVVVSHVVRGLLAEKWAAE